MKLRYLLPLAGVFCTCLSTYAQPSPARQAFYGGACRISSRTMLCYETPLAPLAAYLREYINVETASDSMVGRRRDRAFDRSDAGGEAFRLTVLPQRIEIAGGSYGGVFNGVQACSGCCPPKYTPRTVRSGRDRLHEGRGRAALPVPRHDAGRGPHVDRRSWSETLYRPAFLSRDQQIGTFIFQTTKGGVSKSDRTPN